MRKRNRTKTDYTKDINSIKNIEKYRREWIGYILDIKTIKQDNYYIGKILYKKRDKRIETFYEIKEEEIKIKLDEYINNNNKKENIVFCCEEKKYKTEKSKKKYKNCIEKIFYIKYPKEVSIKCANRKITNFAKEKKEKEIDNIIEREEIKEIEKTDLNIIKINKDYKYQNRAEGLNYKIYLWVFIEKEILTKKDLKLLSKEIKVLYRFSIKLMMDELRKNEYSNYYTHIPIISNILKYIEENYVKNNEIKLNEYIENRFKKIILDIINIKEFKDDGLGLLGILFSIQLDFVSERYLFKEDKIKELLNFHINLLPLEEKKYIYNEDIKDIYIKNINQLKSNRLIENKFNKFLETILGPILNIENKYKEIEKKENKEEIKNLIEKILE